MAKVYVITKGCYSDYHICAVTLDKEKAERLHNEQLEGLLTHMNQLRDAAARRALQMEERVHQLEAERDAAVADLRQASIYLCCACKKYHPAVRGVSHHYCEEIGERDDFTGAISCGMFEWRGVVER